MSSSTTAGAAVALVRANVRYWPTVAPATGRELRRWEQRAAQIPDPVLRGLAISKLDAEHFNAQVATTLTTLAPRAARPSLIRALVALEVAYDYLDGLTERPADEPLEGRLACFAPFADALDPGPVGARGPGREESQAPDAEDGGYLRALLVTVRDEVAGLASWPALAPVAHGAAARTADAQARLHAAGALGDEQLREWAQPIADSAGLGWRELLAGAAASVLACHALIVAAAGPRVTAADAERLDAFYLRLCALSTLLDSLVDREIDQQSGSGSLLRLYPDRAELTGSLTSLAREASALAGSLPDGPHHLMIMAGVVSYYLSAPAARTAYAEPVTAGLRRQLSPLIHPTLAVMRAWRAAKRLRGLSGAGSRR